MGLAGMVREEDHVSIAIWVRFDIQYSYIRGFGIFDLAPSQEQHEGKRISVVQGAMVLIGRDKDLSVHGRLNRHIKISLFVIEGLSRLSPVESDEFINDIFYGISGDFQIQFLLSDHIRNRRKTQEFDMNLHWTIPLKA